MLGAFHFSPSLLFVMKPARSNIFVDSERAHPHTSRWLMYKQMRVELGRRVVGNLSILFCSMFLVFSVGRLCFPLWGVTFRLRRGNARHPLDFVSNLCGSFSLRPLPCVSGVVLREQELTRSADKELIEYYVLGTLLLYIILSCLCHRCCVVVRFNSQSRVILTTPILCFT